MSMKNLGRHLKHDKTHLKKAKKRGEIADLMKGLFLLLIFVSFIGFLSWSVFNGLGRGYSKGSRVGNITKLSNKGFIIKSNEGEMLIGGKNLSTAGMLFRFSIMDEEIKNKVEDALGSSALVRLHYEQFLISPISVNSSYVIVNVEEIEELK